MTSMDGKGEDHKYLKETARNSAQRTESKLHLRVKKMTSIEDHTGLGLVTKGMGEISSGNGKELKATKDCQYHLAHNCKQQFRRGKQFGCG